MRRPLRNLLKYELEEFIGESVEKISGKPFSNGEKAAKVVGVVVNPYTKRWSFQFEGAAYVEAQQCIPVERDDLESRKHRAQLLFPDLPLANDF